MTIKKLQNGSDIRGVAMDTNPQEAVNLGENETFKISLSYAILLSKKTNKPINNLKIAVGMDSRLSGEDLKNIILHSLSEVGITVFDCGLVSTPAMFMSTQFDSCDADGSIMITASHLPSNRNGFKFFTKNGGLDKGDISEILDTASNTDEQIKEMVVSDNTKGVIKSFDLMSEYSAHLRNIIIKELDMGDTPLKNMKITVDAGNGAGGFFATDVLAPLGADVSSSLYLNPDGNFPNHIPNPEDSSAIIDLCNKVKENNSDLGVIFDTDVDRCSAVDNLGKPITKNHIVALASVLVSENFPNSTVVTDSITSDFLTAFLEDILNLKHLRYQRGYKNVINKAIELNNEGIECPLAIETSGHCAFKENFFLDDGAYLATKIVVKATQLKNTNSTLQSLISKLEEPAFSKEYRISISAEDFKSYGNNIIAWSKAWVQAEDCVGPQIDPNDITSQCKMCHCGLSLVEPNYEGIRIKFDKYNGDGWAVIRMSLHDPIIPINIESNSIYGANIILNRLKAFLVQFKQLDISPLDK